MVAAPRTRVHAIILKLSAVLLVILQGILQSIAAIMRA